MPASNAALSASSVVKVAKPYCPWPMYTTVAYRAFYAPLAGTVSIDGSEQAVFGRSTD